MPIPITVQQLINFIDQLDLAFKASVAHETAKPKHQLKQELAVIRDYFDHPECVLGASYWGGLASIKEQYAPLLLNVSLYVARDTLLSPSDAQKVHNGFNLFAQRYKVKRAYTDLSRGKKFKKAKLPPSSNNPVQLRSKANIAALENDLKILNGGDHYHGLREDEIALFACLLNLPYRLQHATNYYYPVINAGSLDSYTEIKRHQPAYESPFSTKGNIDKLGNGGFVFFRLYIDPVNGHQTRYGDTNLVFNLQLLRTCGWISLHDQLNPFPGNSPNSRHFYYRNRLLRTSEALAIHNATKDKTLHDGLLYRYRDAEIVNYTSGSKDTQKSFGATIPVVEQYRSFLDEMFYGEDILLGIALSVIRELRYLEKCGFRALLLRNFSTADAPQQIYMLGELLKNFFRIEGKYPVAVRMQAHLANHPVSFTPIGKTDSLLTNDRHVTVTNPDGDGRFNADLTINAGALATANARAEQRELEEQLSIVRRQRARFKTDVERVALLDAKIIDLEARLKQANEKINHDDKSKHDLMDYFVDNFRVDVNDVLKINTAKLQLIKEKYSELLTEGMVNVHKLLSATTEQLQWIASHSFMELLSDGWVSFEELAQYTPKQLRELSIYDLRKPMVERDMTLAELLSLYQENSLHLDYLTCDDLTEAVLDEAPNVNPILMQYAREEDVDFAWVAEQLGESDRVLFHANLGYYEEDSEDRQDFDVQDGQLMDEEDDEILTTERNLGKRRNFFR